MQHARNTKKMKSRKGHDKLSIRKKDQRIRKVIEKSKGRGIPLKDNNLMTNKI